MTRTRKPASTSTSEPTWEDGMTRQEFHAAVEAWRDGQPPTEPSTIDPAGDGTIKE